MGRSISKRIENYINREEWARARHLILRALKRESESHWLLTRLATTYYEEHRYRKALAISKQTLKLAPRCPLVLWDYASTLDMLGREKQAIKIWRDLLKRGVRRIAYGECSEGLRWARSLINDCRYRLAGSLDELGDTRNAIRYIRSHLRYRGLDTPSVYPRISVKKMLAELSKKSGIPVT